MVQRCKFSIELKNFPPDLSGEPKSCEMHLVLVLSDHVNVGKDPLYRPPKTQKAEEGRTTQTTVYPHVKASGKFPGKNPRAQKAHLYAFKETFLEK